MAMAECVLPRRVNGLASRDQAREVREYRFRDHRTGPIVKRVFFCLLSECNTENEVLSTFTVDLDRLSEADAKVVREASDKAVKLLHREPKAGVRYNVKDFTEEKWDIHSGNMYSEFRKIVQETLKQEANSYGRLVAFLGFAVSYGVYVRGRGIHQALPSVEAWTVQVIEDDVGTFFRENGGWVSGVEVLMWSYNL